MLPCGLARHMDRDEGSIGRVHMTTDERLVNWNNKKFWGDLLFMIQSII